MNECPIMMRSDVDKRVKLTHFERIFNMNNKKSTTPIRNNIIAYKNSIQSLLCKYLQKTKHEITENKLKEKFSHMRKVAVYRVHGDEYAILNADLDKHSFIAMIYTLVDEISLNPYY